ncbi:DNA-binding protein [Pandoraea pnomenusa]|uniref:FitA-like ribbon-helix-helix domain-containing protein n=1 Tax=Pandoraea pnomenusa TaxID=93220 RepID=UPI00333EC56A
MHMMLIEGIDEALMRSIRSRAALHGRTPEEEVLTILDNVARVPGFRTLGEALLAMPNVGLDSDFERIN